MVYHDQTRAYPGFYSMRQLGLFLPPAPHPGWDASPSQGYPLALNLLVPIYTPGKREELYVIRGTVCKNKVSCPRTEHNVPGQG